MTLKLRKRSLFPAIVTAQSPIVITKTGAAYDFSLSINELRTSLDGIYAPLSILDYTTVTDSGTYTVAAADNVVLINKTVAGSSNVQLPEAVSRNGFPVTIKDLKGDAATNNITILPDGTETIDGLSSVPINSNYGSFKLCPVQTGPSTFGWIILA